MFAGLSLQFFQRGLAAKGTAARIGPGPHAVLSDRFQRDESLIDQRGHIVLEDQLVEADVLSLPLMPLRKIYLSIRFCIVVAH